MKRTWTAALGLLIILAASRTAAFAAHQPAIADGDAYAAKIDANIGGPNNLSAGPIAPASLACDTRSATDQNSVASITLEPIITSSGTASDMVTSTYGSSNVAVQSSSVIQGVDVLSGVITATTVQAVANSGLTNGSASSNASGSMFVGLTVGGQMISGTPAPNTRIPLRGLGVVILNEELMSRNRSVATGITVNMIHVRITQSNSFGLPIGASIIVGHADSSIATPPVPVTVDASSYALLATGLVGPGSAKSGPWAPARIPCTGGTAEDDLAQLTLTFANLGTMVDTAMGQVSSSGSSAGAQSQVQNVNVLAGLIAADAVTSDASAALNGSASRSGSVTIVNGSIAGIPISSSPAPNTMVNIANLGYVVLNEQHGSLGAHSAKIVVNAIHLVVTTNNTLGLPVGANVIIANATAGVKRF
ncbi:MAG TPA: choice-of-anchor P family protein [Candidatus Eremiobacteraceae bacterium]|nr:choice-of-anchor P family protein [Candidatus Eremiobacteraceae bacterium]